MNFLKPSELRNTLNISRSTEHRLLKNGMSAIGVGRLRRYDQEAAIEWFRTHRTDTSRNLLAPGTIDAASVDLQARCKRPLSLLKWLPARIAGQGTFR